MKKNHFFCGLLLCCTLGLTGCLGLTQSVPLEVSTLNDPSKPLESYRTFRVVELSEEGSLKEKDLLGLVADHLKRQGFSYDHQNSDLVVTVSFDSRKKEQYVPEQTYYLYNYKPGDSYTYSGHSSSSYSGNAYSSSSPNGSVNYNASGGSTWHGRVEQDGKIVREEYKTNAYTVKLNDNWLRIAAYDAKTVGSPDVEPQLVWEGEASGDTQTSFYQFAPCMVGQLLNGFPTSKRGGKVNLGQAQLDQCLRQ